MVGMPATLKLYPKIPESTIYGWKRSPPLKIVTGDQFRAGSSGPLPALTTFMEEQMRRLLVCARDKGHETTREWIMSMALEFGTNKLFQASEGWFAKFRARSADLGFSFSRRVSSVRKKNAQNPEELMEAVRTYFVAITAARRRYDLEDLDKIIANDEMRFPMEVHSKYIYQLAGVPSTWIHSLGLERLGFTVLFTFTLAGTLLPLTFIFHGVASPRGKVLQQALKWASDLPVEVWIFTNRSAYMTAPVYARYLEKVRRWMQEHKGFALSTHLHLLHDRAGGHIEEHIAHVLRSKNMSQTLIWPTSLLQIWDVSCARILRSAFLCANLLLSRSGQALDPGQATARKRQFHILCGIWYPSGTISDNAVSCSEKLSNTIVATGLKVGATVSLKGDQDSQVRVLVDGVRVEFGPCREKGLIDGSQIDLEEPVLSEAEAQKTMIRLLNEIDEAYALREAQRGKKPRRAPKGTKQQKGKQVPKSETGSDEKESLSDVREPVYDSETDTDRDPSESEESEESSEHSDSHGSGSDEEPLALKPKRQSLTAALCGRIIDNDSPRETDLLGRYILFNFADRGWSEGHIRKFYPSYQGAEEPQYDVSYGHFRAGESVNQTLLPEKQHTTDRGASEPYHWVLLDIPPCTSCTVCKRAQGKKRKR
jgi:hypothetical protein